jgi:uncharacterized protein YcaQ
MTRTPVPASAVAVRRLAVTKQHLGGSPARRATSSAILSVVRDLAYVQWDPVRIVAPSHLISLWSRLEGFRSSTLERMMWDERKLFLHWTPIASIVRTDDFPLYHSLMSRYPESLGRSWGSQRLRAKKFLAEHAKLRKGLLEELRTGPRLLSEFGQHARTKRSHGEWTFGSDVAQMLYHLTMTGEVMVVGHRGTQNLWGLAAEFLPPTVDRTVWTTSEVERESVRRALRALGTGSPTEINYYFVRGRYDHLRSTLASLESEGAIRRVNVEGWGNRDERYILEEDIPTLASMSSTDWQPRVSLLPPFDNLLGSSARTSRLFGFEYVREQFLPREKRTFGTYVLPILSGDALIGRIDPRLDPARGELVINSVHAEPNAPRDRDVADEIRETIARFAAFLGASRVTYPPRVPEAWTSSLR